MNNEYAALFIAIVLIVLVLSLAPRRSSYQDELEENAKRVKQDRINKMQRGVNDGK